MSVKAVHCLTGGAQLVTRCLPNNSTYIGKTGASMCITMCPTYHYMDWLRNV